MAWPPSKVHHHLAHFLVPRVKKGPPLWRCPADGCRLNMRPFRQATVRLPPSTGLPRRSRRFHAPRSGIESPPQIPGALRIN